VSRAVGRRVLVCDDEPGIRRTLGQVLGDEGYEVETAEGGQQALARLLGPGARVDAVLLDVWLPDADGLKVLAKLREGGFEAPVVMISGHGSVEMAVSAVREGADDFLEKPLSLERVLMTLDKVLERRSLARERDALRRELASREEDTVLLGEGPAMTHLKEEIRRAAASDARVLITGESGTGKEVVARTLHRASPRAAGPFVEVNGAAIPETLIESELFGHVKGAFTDASSDRKGKWEEADGGTLFLDEIGDMSPQTQAKVLRAIQDGRITRVGGNRAIATDVRIVAATNRDLPGMVETGSFREDLWFRLAVIPIRVPPLSERTEDIPLLARHFAAWLSRRRGRRPKTFLPAALEELSRRRFRGNVRELQNLVERLVLMTDGEEIGPADLPPQPPGHVSALPSSPSVELAPGQTLAEAREAFERRLVESVLAETRGNVSRAAERLGLDRTTLHRRLKAMGIEPGRD
jgi:two-component system nitrogen regulation response regulator NtrX